MTKNGIPMPLSRRCITVPGIKLRLCLCVSTFLLCLYYWNTWFKSKRTWIVSSGCNNIKKVVFCKLILDLCISQWANIQSILSMSHCSHKSYSFLCAGCVC